MDRPLLVLLKHVRDDILTRIGEQMSLDIGIFDDLKKVISDIDTYHSRYGGLSCFRVNDRWFHDCLGVLTEMKKPYPETRGAVFSTSLYKLDLDKVFKVYSEHGYKIVTFKGE